MYYPCLVWRAAQYPALPHGRPGRLPGRVPAPHQNQGCQGVCMTTQISKIMQTQVSFLTYVCVIFLLCRKIKGLYEFPDTILNKYT